MAFPAIGFREALGTIRRRRKAARVAPGLGLAGLGVSGS
jgi:hypothetical protein